MSATTTVQRKGIYCGLPVFSADHRDLSVIVTGANGISGTYMLQVLSEAPERWSTIYALSRKPPNDLQRLGPKVKFISVDFLKDPQEIAKVLTENKVRA